jgi:catechol 2,3-dioxygenase-like lactoylglutathione lyase family enzyme
MTLSTGINHIALLTTDIDAFLAFYSEVFDAKIMSDQTEQGMRHASVELGAGAVLHAFHIEGNAHATGRPEMFDRGHLDHFGVNVPDVDTLREVRQRLIDRGASDGTVTDFGILRSVSFHDPDGFAGEVALWCDAPPRSYDERTLSSTL